MSELITTNQIADIAKNGAEVLNSNKERAEKAITVGKNILTAINEAGGLNPDLDARCNKYLVNCRNAKKEMEEIRKPITQLFDQIKKEFTSTENDLDIKKDGTLPFIIQTHRNDYVKQIEAEKERKRKAAELKLNQDKERVDVKTVIETQLSNYVSNHISERKDKLQESFNNITLENFEKKSLDLKSHKPVYHKAHWIDFKVSIKTEYISQDDVKTIYDEVMGKKDFDLIAAVVEGDLNTFKKELIEKLPSLKSELERIAAADDEEKQKIEAEKKKREADEKAKRDAEAEAERIKKEEELKSNAAAEKADAAMNNLELFEDNGPETRSGYEIKILHQAGAVELFTFWFEREGAKCTIEELERKSIGQMKTYCQNLAHKTGDIISSKYLKYEPVYKAVNRKTA